MFDPTSIRKRLCEVAVSECQLSPETAREVAFHMTDWLSELSALVGFYEAPEAPTAQHVSELLMAFLVHAPNHLAAAAKLYADQPVADIFGVGAVLERDRGTPGPS